MDSSDLSPLLEQYAPLIRGALDRGVVEYGQLPLAADDFGRCLMEVVVRRTRGDGRLIEAALAAPGSRDLYLTIACDRKTPGAWEAFGRRFHEDLKAVAMRAGSSRAEAEELASELPGLLIRPPATGGAATRLGTYDGSGSLFAWLSSVATRRSIDRQRAQRPPPGALPRPSPDPREAVVGQETCRRLEEALREALLDLSTRETLLLVWKYRDNLPQREMARRLEVSEPRVSQLSRRTVEKVRRAVRKRMRDESAPEWASRAQLWDALRSVVSRLLDGQDPPPG